jgi:putative ABC transport system permease protein
LTRFVWDQLSGARSRTLALASGILVAAVSFVLLTSAASTGAIETKGTVESHFQSAYDVLVRPVGSTTSLEQERGLVRPNYLSGLGGGITLEQWQQILGLPGVEAAAPIENLGFVSPFARVRVRVGDLLASQPPGLYRIRLTWLANGGLSSYPGDEFYINVSADSSRCAPGEEYDFAVAMPTSPFQSSDYGYLRCVRSAADVTVSDGAYFPLLLAAIDPVQENRLLHFDAALQDGGLSENESYAPLRLGPSIPVLASTRTFVDVALQVQAERVDLPAGANLQAMAESTDARATFGRLPGRVVAAQTFTADELYRLLLGPASPTGDAILVYWTVSTVGYRALGSNELEALTVQPDLQAAWGSGEYEGGWYPAPPGNQDVQFRQLTIHDSVSALIGPDTYGFQQATLAIAGHFDPAELPGFDPLSKVPLESYEPPQVEPADAASSAALHGQPLLPTTNLGGYVQQPPTFFTTLQAAMGLLDPKYFAGGNPQAPISAIRVRVAGVSGPDPLSLARIKAVALAIHDRTGLEVDITAGSSPAPMLVHLPAGDFGRPALLVREGWVKKGVAVTILQALDRKSLALFVLVLVVTGLFVANGALAAVRSRRRELGTLLALGWSRPRIFGVVLGEVALIGLLAGLAGAALAAALVRVLGLAMPLTQVLLVAPVATLLATLAGILPAWQAARLRPIDAVRPAVAERGLGLRVRGIGSMAVVNLRRLPGRTLLAATGLFIGVAALALLLSITLAFQGTLVGTALGEVIAIQIRDVDYLGVSLAIVLAAGSVADVLYLNLRERAAELVTLRASGWREAHLVWMVALEGLGIGLLGSLPGAAAGIGLSALVGGSPQQIALAALLAAAAGTGVTLLASLLPATLLSRMTPPAVLAEE